jgi:nitrite reductase/ring-hydroxylating ferredoxin subunit
MADATHLLKVATFDDVAEGKLYPLEIEGELICLAKVEGKIYAFSDNCTHISGPLNEGDLAGCVITCPWHGAQFAITTGKALRGPARQDIMTYPVTIEGDSIYISLPPEE